MTEARMKIAVFIDYDNIEIGVKTTLGGHFDVGAILEAIKERGEVVTKVAYGDWKRSEGDSRALSQHAIRMVQRNLTPGGDKNGADINLALDALEMALTHDHINAYVIVGGDSDFITLVEKLKQYDKKVLIVGGRQFTSVILQRNCHEFIAYENLIPSQARRSPDGRSSDRARRPARVPLEQAFPLVQRGLAVLSEREVSPQLGLLKSTLLQLDSTFSERDYGASTFRDFAEKLAEAGLVVLKHAGRSILVELKDGAGTVTPVVERAISEGEEPPAAEREAPPPLSPAAAASPADAIRIVRHAFQTAVMPLRWPMYVRNVKQLLRAADPTFDERRYGFGGILDILRACQREGLLRLERDRQGVLRVFPGTIQQPMVPSAPEEAVEVAEPAVEVVASSLESAEITVAAEPIAVGHDEEDEEDIVVPDVVDTTAEALADAIAGRSKPRRQPRGRKTAAPRKRAPTTTARKRGPRKVNAGPSAEE
jgi:uncharacterized LabA/DUF88 family protein